MVPRYVRSAQPLRVYARVDVGCQHGAMPHSRIVGAGVRVLAGTSGKRRCSSSGVSRRAAVRSDALAFTLFSSHGLCAQHNHSNHFNGLLR